MRAPWNFQNWNLHSLKISKIQNCAPSNNQTIDFLKVSDTRYFLKYISDIIPIPILFKVSDTLPILFPILFTQLLMEHFARSLVTSYQNTKKRTPLLFSDAMYLASREMFHKRLREKYQGKVSSIRYVSDTLKSIAYRNLSDTLKSIEYRVSDTF